MKKIKSKSYGVIYLIKNKINNKIYIGQTINGFNERYKGDLEKYTTNEHLKNSIIKYGIENFEIDKEFDIASSKYELDKLEDLYIKIYNTTNRKNGYNKKTGGANGRPTKESIEKNRISNSGKNSANYGKKFSKEHSRKISEAQKGKLNHNYGKHISDEHKIKISKPVVCLNYKHRFDSATEGAIYYNCNKDSIGLCCRKKHRYSGKYNGEKLVWVFEDEYLNMSDDNIRDFILNAHNNNFKKVYCVTTNKIFNSLYEAGRCYDIKSFSHIASVCGGKRSYCGKLPDGTILQWMYYKDYLKLNKK